ncbi:MAG TPA: MFS transporter [Nitrososphaeraceae archaeon]|nr:MFS transporter [Nitrososphaeraceae archaeon]
MRKTSQLDANESGMQNPHRWKALVLLALAQFLIILDTSIIGVALPTIQDHFGFSQSDLQWIFNAYVIVFGALLLLGGRLTDILGQKKIFIIGFMILTASSIAAGLASSGSVLIAARAFQGLGAAFIAPSALAIVMTLFGNNKNEMNKAMGIWGAAAPAGGTAGVFWGGIITAWVDWTWVFLINVPIGIAVLALASKLLPKGEIQKGKVDYAGAITVTGALILLVYAIVTANEIGWTALQSLATLSIAGVLFFGFLYMQKKSKEPLLPLNIFKIRNLLASNIVMGLLGAAWIPMWFFLNLYLQLVLGYGAFESGLALLPMTVAIMFLMVFITPKMVNRFGVRKNMIVGMALLSLGMISFIMTPPSNANQGSSFFIYVLPASLIAAIGMSLAYIPVLTAALSNIQPKQAGLGSGLVNTSYQIGSALGLAIMVAWSSEQSEALISSGVPQIIAMNNGFHFAFIGSAIISAIATALILFLIKNKKQREIIK